MFSKKSWIENNVVNLDGRTNLKILARGLETLVVEPLDSAAKIHIGPTVLVHLSEQKENVRKYGKQGYSPLTPFDISPSDIKDYMAGNIKSDDNLFGLNIPVL